ncbi:MAG: Na+-transporting NADH:ubiquinone oxidoreductase subunit B [Chlamydiales bacterium]|jgi:Na+-transporting NADH:ubiquinone oxidoreductase subunit B
MLRKILDYKLSFFEKGKPLHPLRPFISAADAFFYEVPENTHKGPHIRDAVDLKRWMIMVIFALIPCILMAIWNTGLQKFVYAGNDFSLMNEYLAASTSFDGYLGFAAKDNRFLEILKLGSMAFFPVMIISYAVGGFWEGVFACVRKHEIAEGFLVTGMLYPLILPSTIPYWMVAVGVSVGVILSKELFGGTGMNIMNPALVCRAFLFFSFPNKMSGDVWVGTNPTLVSQSVSKMNLDAAESGYDGFAQATHLAVFNISEEVKRVHVDAIASNNVGADVGTFGIVQRHFDRWNSLGGHDATLGQLTSEQTRNFVTSPIAEGGLALAPENYQAAYEFSSLNYGIGHNSDATLFFGDMLGSMGETSVLACLLGAFLLIYFGVGSWRSMLAVTLGALGTAFLYQFGAENLGFDGGAWNPAKYALPAYKHLLMGGLAFGLVFMATDPVSSPSMNSAKWIYGLIVGAIVIVIRTINPAYPEGTMLAILLGNVFAPLIDHYCIRNYRRVRRVRAT